MDASEHSFHFDYVLGKHSPSSHQFFPEAHLEHAAPILNGLFQGYVLLQPNKAIVQPQQTIVNNQDHREKTTAYLRRGYAIGGLHTGSVNEHHAKLPLIGNCLSLAIASACAHRVDECVDFDWVSTNLS